MSLMAHGFKPVRAAPAASLLLVRDGIDGLEVLMVERSRAMRFASGMMVFPGGRVDPGDASAALIRHIERPAGKGARRLGPHDAYRLAALRELFEETGLLRARLQSGRLSDVKRQHLAQRYRHALQGGGLTLSAFARRAGLLFRPDELVPFAHWITPELSPKRFDTRFYLAPAPIGQRPSSDGIENIHLDWWRPSDLLKAWEKGTRPLMFPTRLNLMKLSRAQTVAEAMQQARRTPIITIIPEIIGPGQRRFLLPAEAGFGITEATHEDLDPSERKLISKAAKSAFNL
ncbi:MULTISPECIES: NUDIX domain-containing protein [unclassified Iodidimonas]|uniref:NUDIX hydrolase n=1 Tax=unclassified Iodidimonas TaxID=2626145 RepID=UPI0024831641|nr:MULTISPECIES: NUDIX domain-containing protein [unclassified Iodidimonas]